MTLVTSAAAKVHIGKVSGISLETGYGFIECDAYPENVFVHFSDLIPGRVPVKYDQKTGKEKLFIKPDSIVQFEVVIEPRGPRARRVRVVGWK